MSKTFRFRLQRLLELRRLEEREAESVALAAAARATAAEEACAALRRDRERTARELPETATRPDARPGDTALLLAHAVRLDEALKRLEAERDQLRKAAAEAEAERARRRAARRALEELETKAREQWAAEVRRLEIAEIDEIAATRHLARRDAAGE
jgi:flagellar biosynthesis chaperone FliJ